MLFRGLSLLFLGLGIFVLSQVALPYLSFKSWELFAYEGQTVLADPRPEVDNLDLASGVSIEQQGNFPAFVVKGGMRRIAPYNEFQLTIPSLNINSLKVSSWSNDFDDNPAQLPGSAFPGEKGNVFISAHSSLPNELIPEKKTPYFVNLPNIKVGDEVILSTMGQYFHYTVQGMKIVDPKDISVVNPPDQTGRYITLMTCVPPGFSTKRLVVLGKLKI